MRTTALVFACHQAVCAPPPVGKGGSSPNYYSAQRDPRTKTWKGWMQYGGKGSITETPDAYPSKSAALKAIKEQHP